MPGRRRCRAATTVTALLLLGAVAACGDGTTTSGSGGDSATASTAPSGPMSGPMSGPKGGTPSSTARPPDGAQALTITVNGSDVTPAPHRVKLVRGATLALTVVSDHDDQLHAHGFEVEQELSAGRPTTIELVGGEPGLYDVELHHPELTILQVQVG